MKHNSTIVTLRCALMTLALAACSEATPEAPLAEAGVDESTAITEQRVLVTGPNDRNRTAPLQGAILSCLQDGLLTTYEADAQGVATLTISPKGGPVTVSVSHPGYLATTLVNYDKAVFHELVDAKGNLWLNLRSTASSQVAVEASLERVRSDSFLRVRSNVQNWEKITENTNFTAYALAYIPFTLTAFEQRSGEAPDPDRGNDYSITAWHTFSHPGGSLLLSIVGSAWVKHTMASFSLTAARPLSIPSMAGDDTVALAYADLPIAHDQGIVLPGAVAETSRLAPWRGKDHYDITLRGRADLMQRPDVHMRVQLVNSRQEYTALNFRDGLRSSLDDRYLAPAKVLTLPDATSDRSLSWRIDGGEASWVFLIAGDAEGQRWQVMVPPGVTTLDMSQLASALSPQELGLSALDAVLLACEPHGKRNGCKRESVSAPFVLPTRVAAP